MLSDLQPESGVVGSSIKYRTAFGSEYHFGKWQPLPLNGTGEILEPATSITFHEGADNWIQWQAEDIIGNGPSTSPPYRIPIDTEGVSFHGFSPPSNYVQGDTAVLVTITVADLGGSGVNISTIKAAVKTAGQNIYGDWFDPGFSIISNSDPSMTEAPSGPETVTLEAEIDLLNGTDNFIKFRALDFIGNGFTESEEYNIKVDVKQTELFVSLIEPKNNSIVRTAYPILKWQPRLPVQFDVLSYHVYISENPFSPKQFFQSGSPLSDFDGFTVKLPGSDLKLDLGSGVYDALSHGNTYYWTVLPIIQSENDYIVGECTDGLWEFKIILVEAGLELDIEPKSIQIFAGESSVSQLKIRNIGKSDDNFTLVFIPNGGLSITLSKNHVFLSPGEIQFLNLTVSSSELNEGGEFIIRISAYSQSDFSEKNVDLKVKVVPKTKSYVDEEEKTKGSISSSGSIMVMILIMLFLVLITYGHHAYVNRRSLKRPENGKIEEEELTLDAETKSRPVVIVGQPKSGAPSKPPAESIEPGGQKPP